MRTCLIISGGDECDICWQKGMYVIACDKGAEYAAKQGIPVDLIIGDFDSYTGNLHKDFSDIKILKYPVEKDDTDTMLAIKQALELDYRHLIITCALGGRMDHTIANFQALHYIASHGAIGELRSDREHMKTLSAEGLGEVEINIAKKEGYSLSLFALSKECPNVSIEGTKYDGQNITFTFDFPLGYGNMIEADEAKIILREGTLLIVESRI